MKIYVRTVYVSKKFESNNQQLLSLIIKLNSLILVMRYFFDDKRFYEFMAILEMHTKNINFAFALDNHLIMIPRQLLSF